MSALAFETPQDKRRTSHTNLKTTPELLCKTLAAKVQNAANRDHSVGNPTSTQSVTFLGCLVKRARLFWHPVEWRQPDGTATALADAEGQRQREPADEAVAIAGSGAARDEPRDNGRALAVAADRQFPQPWWRAEGRKGSGPDGARLADADGERWLQAERGQSADGRSDPCGGDVDDPNSAGSQGRGDDTGEYAGERPAWPPGPGDEGGWERYLAAAPDLEPAVRRGADGLAHRVDRLRLCGNGVVPLVAAYALRTLAAELLADG